MDKILRRQTDYPDGLEPESLRRMNDLLGTRVIVFFVSQLPLIDRELRNSNDFELSPRDRPVAYLGEHLYRQLGLSHIDRKEKESGYASLHYTVRLRQKPDVAHENPYFELQLRTLAEDLWGEIEHILGYKPGKRTSFAVRKQFRIIGRNLEALDEHFNFLFEELARFQEETVFEDTDPLNAENLPYLLREFGLGCAQGEIHGLLKLLFSRGIATVLDLRAASTPRRIEVIRNSYLQEEGRQPINFEFVANLANLVGVDDESTMVARIRAQREFLDFWTRFKHDA